MSPTATSLDQSLSTVPFISQAEIDNLKKELPDYIARVADLSEEFDPVKWWSLNSTTLPHWSTYARKISLIQPSSAVAERVFSLIKASFGDSQDSSLQDYNYTSFSNVAVQPGFCPHWSTVAILAATQSFRPPLGYFGHYSLYLAAVTLGLYIIRVMAKGT